MTNTGQTKSIGRGVNRSHGAQINIMATTKLVQNAAGAFVEESTNKGAAKLRKSNFRDEQEADVYHDEVSVTGGVVYVREMDDLRYSRLLDLQSEFNQFVSSASENEAKALEIEKSQPKVARALRDEMEAGLTAIRAKNAAFTRELIESQIAGWSFERTYSPEAFTKLVSDSQTAVLEKVMSASLIGREDSSFLAPPSAQS